METEIVRSNEARNKSIQPVPEMVITLTILNHRFFRVVKRFNLVKWLKWLNHG